MKLQAIYDLRETDPITGEKYPLFEGEISKCARCGRDHAIVYEVITETNEIVRYGETCFKRMTRCFRPESIKQAAIEGKRQLGWLRDSSFREEALKLCKIIVENNENVFPISKSGAELCSYTSIFEVKQWILGFLLYYQHTGNFGNSDYSYNEWCKK